MSAPRPRRVLRTATVVRTHRLTPQMVRLLLRLDDAGSFPVLTCTDHYIKLLFAPAGADYAWPFDPERIRDSRPAAMWPVTRTYTIRSHDAATGEIVVDVVVHGEDGLAGPWAARAQPGESVGFYGPGGAFAPETEADVHLFVGDESATPAIAASLEQLPRESRAQVYLEAAGPEHEVELPLTDDTTVTWVHRRPGETHGVPLASVVRAEGLPEGDLCAFVHGNAEMVRDLRRWLFVENGVGRTRVSISGYWRTGLTEDQWQASKKDFNAQVEAEEAAALTRR